MKVLSETVPLELELFTQKWLIPLYVNFSAINKPKEW